MVVVVNMRGEFIKNIFRRYGISIEGSPSCYWYPEKIKVDIVKIDTAGSGPDAMSVYQIVSPKTEKSILRTTLNCEYDSGAYPEHDSEEFDIGLEYHLIRNNVDKTSESSINFEYNSIPPSTHVQEIVSKAIDDLKIELDEELIEQKIKAHYNF